MKVTIDMKWITDEIERLDKPIPPQEFSKMSAQEVYRIQGQLIALEKLKRRIEES